MIFSMKKIIKRYFVPTQRLPDWLNEYFKSVPPDYVRHEINTLGGLPRMVKSLRMESAPGTAETIISLVAKEEKKLKVLDYGCGPHKSSYLRWLGFKVTSVDIQKYGDEDVVVVGASEKKLPFVDDEFDIVIASEVIEHVEDPFSLIHELLRVSNKYVVLSTPNVVSWQSKFIFLRSNFFKWFQEKDFSYHISPIFYWQIENFCKRNGYVLEKTLGNNSIYFSSEINIYSTSETLIFKIKKGA